jgi:hypothetical protein
MEVNGEEKMEVEVEVDFREEILNLGEFFKTKMGAAFQPKHAFLNRFFVVGVVAYMQIPCGENHPFYPLDEMV